MDKKIIENKFKEAVNSFENIAKACGMDVGGPPDPDFATSDDINWLSGQINNLYSYISQLQTQLYQFQQTSIPPIIGAEKMQNVLDVLGLSGDYEIQKKVIYASDGQVDGWNVSIRKK